MASWNLVNNGWGNALLVDGTNPLPEPMMTYYQMQSKKQTLEKFQRKYANFNSRKYTWNVIGIILAICSRSISAKSLERV